MGFTIPGRPAGNRLWEIDFLRGSAVMLMVVSNAMMDISLFSGYVVDVQAGFWLYFARMVASMFVLIAGISVTLSRSKQGEFSGFLKRGIRLFGWGLLITAVTFIAFPENTIWFGVLHLIGLSIILSYPLLKRKYLSLITGAILITLGFISGKIILETPWLLWLGFRYPGFTSFDYVPLLPWLGIFLVGIFLGNTFYPNGKSRYRIGELKMLKPIAFIGRRSLLVYLAHQPVIVGLILLAGHLS